ncbi:MAG: hypothetical protein ACJ74O_07445 [Frankiaceae bacterium]
MTGYQHLAVRTSHERVVAVLAAGVTGCPPGAQAQVGPTEDRWCGVIPSGGADAAALAATLSDGLGAPVLWVRVDAALDVRLYVFGEEIVAYRSPDVPGPAAGLAAVGVVERLIDATDARALPGDLARVLVADYPDPGDRYHHFVTVLGLPGYLVGAGGEAGQGSAPPGFVVVTGGER